MKDNTFAAQSIERNTAFVRREYVFSWRYWQKSVEAGRRCFRMNRHAKGCGIPSQSVGGSMPKESPKGNEDLSQKKKTRTIPGNMPSNTKYLAGMAFCKAKRWHGWAFGIVVEMPGALIIRWQWAAATVGNKLKHEQRNRQWRSPQKRLPAYRYQQVAPHQTNTRQSDCNVTDRFLHAGPP